MKNVAHTAKGSSWLMKFNKFAAFSEQMEIYADKEWDKLPPIIKKLEAEWENIKIILRPLLGKDYKK